jgi:hypothetical protein
MPGLVGLLLGFSAAGHAAQTACAPTESRLIVYGNVENLRASVDGPLKRPLLKFMGSLTDEVTQDVYSADVYASRYIPDSGEPANLAVIFNAADANKMVQLSIAASPDPKKDPYFIVKMQLVGVSRAADYSPSHPDFTSSATLWEKTFRLEVDAPMDATVKDFAKRAATEMLPLLKQ